MVESGWAIYMFGLGHLGVYIVFILVWALEGVAGTLLDITLIL